MKAAAEEQEKKTRLLLDGSKDAVIVLNERGLIESFNPSAESLFVRPTEDVLGRHASLILPEKVMRPFSARMEMLVGDNADNHGSLPSINNTELLICRTGNASKEMKKITPFNRWKGNSDFTFCFRNC